MKGKGPAKNLQYFNYEALAELIGKEFETSISYLSIFKHLELKNLAFERKAFEVVEKGL